MTDQDEFGPLYDVNQAKALERADRENPIPGGEPECPVCGSKLARLVEQHQSLGSGKSPFRIRLVCGNQDCRRWTVYDW